MSNHINPGAIVLVDWRDKHYASEPGRIRPAVIVVSSQSSLSNLHVFTVVPLTGDPNLAPTSFSTRIDPSKKNGLKKTSYALAWNIQTVSKERLTTTTACVTATQVHAIREVLIEYISSSKIGEETTREEE